MANIDIYFPAIRYTLPFIFVKGSGNATWQFGGEEKTAMTINDFYISKYPVTQRLWEHIMGRNPAHFKSDNNPVEVVSFHDITAENGFLHQLNSCAGNKFQLEKNIVFRLPSETEWEYAARGGIHWTDGFLYSGSNDLNEVGWYEMNSGKYSDPEILSRLKNTEKALPPGR